MGAAAGAVAFGVGLGLAWPRLGATWSRSGAIVDADFANDRYVFAGRNHASKAAFLLAIGGSEAAGAVSIGPYAIPGAPEKLLNADFSAGTANWASHRGGTISAAGGVCTLAGNGGNVPGFAQAVALQKGHAYQFRGKQRKSGTPTPSWTVSSASDLGGTNACHMPDTGASLHEVASTFSADAATMYAGGRQVQNPSHSLAANYGGRFVDAYAALAAANNGSSQDLADVANGYTPASLRTDPIHLNDAGYSVVAAAFKSRNDALGW